MGSFQKNPAERDPPFGGKGSIPVPTASRAIRQTAAGAADASRYFRRLRRTDAISAATPQITSVSTIRTTENSSHRSKD